MLLEKCRSKKELRKKFLKKQSWFDNNKNKKSLDKFIYYNFGLWSLISEFYFVAGQKFKTKTNNHHHQFFCNSFIGQKKILSTKMKNFRVSIRSKHTTNTGCLLRLMPGLELAGQLTYMEIEERDWRTDLLNLPYIFFIFFFVFRLFFTQPNKQKFNKKKTDEKKIS